MADADPFLVQLTSRCVAGPAVPTGGCAVPSPTTDQLILRYLAAACSQLYAALVPGADAGAPTPSVVPVLRGTGSLLCLWLRPWVALALLLRAALAPSAPALLLAALLLWRMALHDWQLRRSLWHAGPVPPGLYYADTARNRNIAARLRASASFGLEARLSRWVWNGDLQTLLPFLAYRSAPPAYSRFWCEAHEPGCARSELLALDVALPPGGFDRRRPVALICHGLNGGSAEAYVCDYVAHATRERGWTCVVMVARGLGGTPVRSGRLFHGARTSDLATAARLVASCVHGAPLVGVGFSMGAIVLANYCGAAGEANDLACAIGLSGCYDCVANRHFAYGRDYWQPWLTQQLKTNFCTRQPHASLLAACPAVDLPHLLSAKVANVTHFDQAAVVPLNGFADVDAYYAAMSLAHGGGLARVSVPLLALHAANDPIVDSATFAPAIAATTAAHGAERNPNCWFRITRKGGHVGWPLGLWPPRQRWLFMHAAVHDFADAVLGASASAGEGAAGTAPS